MKNFGLTRAIVFITSAMLLGAASSKAQITGEVWQNQPGAAGDALLSDAGALGAPDAKFNSGAINYQSQVTAYTTGAYLNSPAFFDESVNFATSAPGYGAGASVDNNFFYFTGQVFLNAGNNSFVVAHDDGLQLNIDGVGLVVNEPGPTAEDFTPFTVFAATAGNYGFELAYGECCGAPADLVWDINTKTVGAAPDSGLTMGLLGMGLTGMGLVARRLKK